VGNFRGQLPPGAGVVPGQQIGTLSILGRVHPLLAPEGARGTVLDLSLDPGLHAVDYGRPLFRLGAGPAAGSEALEREVSQEADLSGRQIAVRSPTEGIFYRRSDPQSPPYVEVGTIVDTGHPLGLVEVMKCFNQVRYGGPGLPQRARVVAIPAQDSAEIQFDQLLFVLEEVD
jgi:acetyl-CoA carboxylase biotin carboxyl carrier protein